MFGTNSVTPKSGGITAPMNINAVIAHLVEMTPPQRKQFAQMHMDDPMMLSAAKYVDNQVSKQAAAISAQQMGAAPPPVNQQVVAQMSAQPPAPQAAPQPQATPQAAPQPQGQAQPMPEGTGIAQLPAPNMNGMAEGGIVAFGDGGTTNALGQEIDPTTGYPVPVYQRLMSAIKDSPGYQNYREMVDNPYGYTGNSGPHPRNKPAVPEVPAAAASTPPAAAKDDRTKRDPRNYRQDTAPEKKQGIAQLRAEKTAATAPAAPPAAASPDYNAAFNSALKSQGNPRNNLPPEIAEIGDLAKAQRDKAMALADKQSEGLSALVSQRQARQDAREQNIAQQEAVNPWMAMITGGLGIAQSKGKGLSGLAEGAQLGVNQYMTDAKYTNAQRQKLEDARDALQDLQYNAETMTNKDRLAAENSLTQGLMAVKDATVKHIQHKEDVNERTAGRIFDAGVQQGIETQREGHQERLQSISEAGANARAAMQEKAASARANQLPGEARTLMLLGGGDLKKGMEMQAAISAGKFNPMTAYTLHYLPGFAGKETLTQPMSYPQFLATLGMPAVRP